MRINGTFDIEQIDDTIILTALTDLGEFELENVKKRFEETLDHLSMRHVDNIIIDLDHADFYGSTALAFFVRLWKLAKSNGGEFALCNVSKHGWEALRVTHLNRLWAVFLSKEDALQTVMGSGHYVNALCV